MTATATRSSNEVSQLLHEPLQRLIQLAETAPVLLLVIQCLRALEDEPDQFEAAVDDQVTLLELSLDPNSGEQKGLREVIRLLREDVQEFRLRNNHDTCFNALDRARNALGPVTERNQAVFGRWYAELVKVAQSRHDRPNMREVRDTIQAVIHQFAPYSTADKDIPAGVALLKTALAAAQPLAQAELEASQTGDIY